MSTDAYCVLFACVTGGILLLVAVARAARLMERSRWTDAASDGKLIEIDGARYLVQPEWKIEKCVIPPGNLDDD